MDDFNLLITGDDLEMMQIHMQVAINMLCRWAQDNRLNFSAEKTKVMIFTRRNKILYRPHLHLGGAELEIVEQFKYLGVTLDSKLKWTPHVMYQAEKATKTLMICRRMIGKNWGLNPKNSAWAYTAIARPILMYGAVAWVGCLDKKQVKKILTKVQSRVGKNPGFFDKTQPTGFFWVLLGFTGYTGFFWVF